MQLIIRRIFRPAVKIKQAFKYGKTKVRFEIRKGMRMHCVVRKPMGKAIGNER